MADSSWCKTCGGYAPRPEHHRCPPTWFVWSDDLDRPEEDALEVRANDAELAAQTFAGTVCGDDSEYYSSFENDVVKIHCRRQGIGNVHVVEVTGEKTFEFRADDVTEEEEETNET